MKWSSAVAATFCNKNDFQNNWAHSNFKFVLLHLQNDQSFAFFSSFFTLPLYCWQLPFKNATDTRYHFVFMCDEIMWFSISNPNSKLSFCKYFHRLLFLCLFFHFTDVYLWACLLLFLKLSVWTLSSSLMWLFWLAVLCAFFSGV